MRAVACYTIGYLHNDTVGRRSGHCNEEGEKRTLKADKCNKGTYYISISNNSIFLIGNNLAHILGSFLRKYIHI